MLKQIQVEIEALLAPYHIKAEGLTIPPKSEMGDLAFPCFALAKAAGKKPNEIAKEIVDELTKKLSATSIVKKAQDFGPYVNFFLRAEAITEVVLKGIKKKGKEFGFNTEKKKGQVMVEYSQPNTHKEFHIGHVRNVCIGSSVVNMFRLNGYKTISANYIGDIGAHVAKCLWYIKKFQPGVPQNNRGRWLGMMYTEASRLIEEKPELKTEVAEVQRKLESGEKEWVSLWEETKEWSMESFKKIYQTLGVEFDEWFFESDVEKPGKKMVQELLKKGVAKKGEGGAVIVDLSQYGLDIFLILKSDGTSLYATKDLALAQEKFKRFKIDKSIYVVDNRQRQYFNQLFKTLELMGWKKDLVFLGYDFVTLPSGAMSSRRGNVVLFDDLYNEVNKFLRNETAERHQDWPAETIEAVAKKLSLAAIKFDMLKHPIDKMIIFDIKEATSVEGFSGPYLLYVVARINSLAAKAKKEKLKPGNDLSGLTSEEEKKLAVMMGEAEAMISKAISQYNPSVITRYCFELAQAFNDFYNKFSVLSAESKELSAARLALSLAVKQVLENMLSVLAIDTVEEM